MTAAPPSDLLQFVMFYAFRARDAEAEAQIVLCARSIASSYPEAQVVLLTNTPDVDAVLSASVRVEVVNAPSRYVMVERLHAYRNWVKAAPANAVLVFMDTDMLVIRRFDELLEPGADLAVTVRRDPVWPINAGLLVMRSDDRAGVEAFFDRLVETCERLNEDERLWYGDQISLAKLLVPTPGRFRETYAEMRNGLTVRFAPSRFYNQTPRPWMMRLGVFRGPARILHFKGNRKHRMELYARIHLSAFARAVFRRRSRG